MSEFEYVKKEKNKFGHIQYECKCHVCGKTVFYSRAIKTKLICFPCQKQHAEDLLKAKQKKHDDEIWNKAIDEYRRIITEGIDVGIRCAMCTNAMANDRGCDGGCIVNQGMYAKVMEVIERHIKFADELKEGVKNGNN